MTTIIYVGIALVFLLMVLGVLARAKPVESNECAAGQDPGQDHDLASHFGQARWLDLSERIFDPSDARWLREDLAFPRLADSLAESRKALAIRWLHALRTSFNELVLTPAAALDETSARSSVASWQMLWLTVRFQFLLTYALLVVRIFGPYHRLIPSFGWVSIPRELSARLARPVFVDNRDVS